MSSANYRVRRATLDDLGQLTALWKVMNFPLEDLGKRVTEFQVAEDAEGKLVGALGLQIAERQGLIHGEAFPDFALADTLRPMLWERVHAVGTNHGLLRLWTQEQAPFWTHCGLVKANGEILVKLPAPWKTRSDAWLTLKLKDDVQAILSADKEFAVFMASEKQRTQRAFQQAKVLKFIATMIALALFGVVLVGAFFVFRHNPGLLRR
jgi:N-acetylglutamate synthase-like GNAT family acetyltransferase